MSANTEHRKLAAIMFTDRIGYSALVQKNEALALRLLEEHRSLLRSLVSKVEGQEIMTRVDALRLEFGSPLAVARWRMARAHCKTSDESACRPA